MRTLPTSVLAYELSRPLYDWGGKRPRRARLEDEAVRRAVVGGARVLGRGGERVARKMLEDPRAVAESAAAMLEAYWKASFAGEWARIEPLLGAAVEEAGRDIARIGLIRSCARSLPSCASTSSEPSSGSTCRTTTWSTSRHGAGLRSCRAGSSGRTSS